MTYRGRVLVCLASPRKHREGQHAKLGMEGPQETEYCADRRNFPPNYLARAGVAPPDGRRVYSFHENRDKGRRKDAAAHGDTPLSSL